MLRIKLIVNALKPRGVFLILDLLQPLVTIKLNKKQHKNIYYMTTIIKTAEAFRIKSSEELPQTNITEEIFKQLKESIGDKRFVDKFGIGEYSILLQHNESGVTTGRIYCPGEGVDEVNSISEYTETPSKFADLSTTMSFTVKYASIESTARYELTKHPNQVVVYGLYYCSSGETFVIKAVLYQHN